MRLGNEALESRFFLVMTAEEKNPTTATDGRRAATQRRRRIPPPPPMAGDDPTAIMSAIQSLLRLVHDVARTSATGFTGAFKKDCTRRNFTFRRRRADPGYKTEEGTGELDPEAVENGGSVGFRRGGHGLKVSPSRLFDKVITYRDFAT
ncbi:hypothetical protein LXL04_013349 [Taraxacum kok-saghyz]